MLNDFRDLVPLNDEYSRLGQLFRFRSFTKRAKDLGLVFKIEKTLFIKQSRTHEVVESLTTYPPTNVRMPSDRPKPEKFVSDFIRHRELLKRFARAEKEKREESKRLKRERQRVTAWRRKVRAKQRAMELREQKKAARLAAKQKKPPT
jgi:hypothetical protein